MTTLQAGYKQTEIGVIPEDWEVKTIGSIVSISVGRDLKEENYSTYQDEIFKYPVFSNTVSNEGLYGFYNISEYSGNSLTVVGRGIGLGKAFKRSGEYGAIGRLLVLFPEPNIDADFLAEYINEKVTIFTESGGIPQLTGISIAKYKIPLPPTKTEQQLIATALSDTDALIESLEKLIVKKRQIKQGAMQELLSLKEGWEVKNILETMDCFDNLRVPLNETQRNAMKGDIPYCGANGVVGFVNDYVIDDDIILIAEDGGYFDEYAYRPIAYRMIGKCWVNNHAHILKAKFGFDQGFLFYSLVHKNILNFLASGTRAKLNKSEMWKIEVNMPLELSEQTAIATILSDMDAEINALEERLEKTRTLKSGMMHELLTGRIRLI